jgi:predicted GH43/DUF377 family glycosyl hydrolase
MNAKRTGIVICPSHSRVVFRPFQPVQEGRTLRIIARVMALTDKEVDDLLTMVMSEFHSRHQRIRDFFLMRFDQVKQFLLTDQTVSLNRQLLIGSFFSQEYALESAALFNPSMIEHPDQGDLPPGSRRFILSLRATGEGHLSSIIFRTGIVDEHNQIKMDEPSRYVTAPEAVPNALYEKSLFHRKLVELGLASRFVERVLEQLDDHFTLEQLEETLVRVQHQHRIEHREEKPTAEGVLALAKSNYEIRYRPDFNLGERIVFPSSPSEQNGIEDARFVKFTEDDGTSLYYATYTAYDGKMVLPQLLETTDFLHFKLNTLNGPEVQNKGFALFPRRINGRYAMLSRQDNENVFLMFSDMIHFWYSKELIMKPTFPWEFVQIGNCGSPIETEAGWLVLSHGVGPMRKYCIGAFLLDLHNPMKVIGRLGEPLLQPDNNEREGYVPNVVYSCGAMLHGREVIIPYAMSDYATSFATVGLDELLSQMTKL